MKRLASPTSRVVGALALAVGLACLSGCTGASGDQSAGGSYPTEYAYDEGEVNEAGFTSVLSAADAERLIARNAVISLVVNDVEEGAAKARSAIADLGGSVMQESFYLPADETDYGRVVLEVVVPPDQLDKALNLIAGLGQVSERRIEAIDVTDEVVDVETRIETMRESIKRLQDLMQQSGSVADIATVEAELTVRQAELESLLARQQRLSQSVATSPILIEMSTEVDALEFKSAGFFGGLKAGWKSLMAAGGVALTTLGALIPWAVVAAIIAVPTVMIHRRWRRNRLPRPRPAPMPRMVPVPMAMPGFPPPGMPGAQAPHTPGAPPMAMPGAHGAPPGPPPSAPPMAQPPPTQNPPTLPPT